MELPFGKLHLRGIARRFAYAKPRKKNNHRCQAWFDGMLSLAVILEPGVSALLAFPDLQLIIWVMV